MGDRVLITFTDDGKTFTPAIYMHWGGESAPDLIREAAPLLRRGDASYAAARFCGFCHTQSNGPTGLGLLPGPGEQDTDFSVNGYGHGDAGVYFVDMNTGAVDAKGGYGKPFQIDPAVFAR